MRVPHLLPNYPRGRRSADITNGGTYKADKSISLPIILLLTHFQLKKITKTVEIFKFEQVNVIIPEHIIYKLIYIILIFFVVLWFFINVILSYIFIYGEFDCV